MTALKPLFHIISLSCMPTFKFYKNGQCVDTLEGASEARLKEIIEKHK